MRRRPIEFWWISAYCVARAALLSAGLVRGFGHFGSDDRGMVSLYATAVLIVPVLLFFAHPSGRWLSVVVLGVEAVDAARRMFEGAQIGSGPPVEATLTFGTCLWLSAFMQRAATARLFDDPLALRVRNDHSPTAPDEFEFFCLFDLIASLACGWFASWAGAPVWLAIACGFSAYVLYGVFLEDGLRSQCDSLFSRIEPGFPKDEVRIWRLACGALARNQLTIARKSFDRFSASARSQPCVILFEKVLKWQVLLSFAPLNGRDALRRLIFDHDFAPASEDRKRIATYAEHAGSEELRTLTCERAELISALVPSLNSSTRFFRTRGQRILTRITGETFAFNGPESWAAWWNGSAAHWSGDAGPAELVARLIYRRCDGAAAHVARTVAGRAEEPLLVEFAEQMRFFNSMREAAQGAAAPASFMNHPLQVLLVPEWADAAGWLHADSPILQNLGISKRAAARRLVMRARLLDYVGSFWTRYPADLNADLPWLLPLLAGKSFGVMRARLKFESWWPKARGAVLDHARATNSGLSAFAAGDIATAETAFESALRERPGDLSARYNLSLCRMRRNDGDGAEKLLRELAAMEPKEPYWWMALGDLLRSGDKPLAARAAYRRAEQLGASEGRVALHLGLTFAHEERDSEAIQLFARALGKNPTVSKLEALAMQLENEGCWKLAGHYREQAMRRELDGPGLSDGERGDESAA